MKIVNKQSKTIDQNAEVSKREIGLRSHMAELGYRLMHRRGGQYWLMVAEPMTLDQIEIWARLGNRSHKHRQKNSKVRKTG